jgi:endonuclease/exonuclease/phosphatase family metal-dependent hydrolase
MKISKKNLVHFYSEIVLISIVFLFFFQLISDFVESIYALNLIEVELNENILSVLLLLSPIFLIFFKKKIPIIGVVITGEILVIMRILAPLYTTQLKMIFSGIGLACFMIFWPSLIQILSKKNSEDGALKMGTALAIALISSIFLRTLGSTIDISTLGYFQWIGWILAIILGAMIFNMKSRSEIVLSNINEGNRSTDQLKSSNPPLKPSRSLKILALSLGLMGIITLVYFAFSSPIVLSRWTGGNYVLILSILIISSTIFVFIQFYRPSILTTIRKKYLIIWNVLFFVFLVLAIVINQIYFIFVIEYPIYAFPTTIFHDILLIIMLILFPVILIDFTFLSKGILMGQPSPRKIGGSFTIAAFFLVFLIFSNVFTIAWDYIPLIGDFFRDMIWLVYLILGLSIILPVSILRKKNLIRSPKLSTKRNIRVILVIVISIFCITSIFSSILLETGYLQAPASPSSIRILSYNIQQGYDEFGNKNFEGQYRVIQTLAPDIIGLQESDTSRISGGNSDIVRYINERLHYYSYFGPKTVTGTFGITLLSKYPIKNAYTFYMESKGEQTATIGAQITVSAITYNIFVTHLGNYENASVDRSQIVQQENILEAIAGKNNIILMGDFNFIPFTEQYNITLDFLDDAWIVADTATIGNVPLNWQPRLPSRRIDHIFISPELNTSISEVQYTGGSAADHPAVYMELDIS